MPPRRGARRGRVQHERRRRVGLGRGGQRVVEQHLRPARVLGMTRRAGEQPDPDPHAAEVDLAPGPGGEVPHRRGQPRRIDHRQGQGEVGRRDPRQDLVRPPLLGHRLAEPAGQRIRAALRPVELQRGRDVLKPGEAQHADREGVPAPGPLVEEGYGAAAVGQARRRIHVLQPVDGAPQLRHHRARVGHQGADLVGVVVRQGLDPPAQPELAQRPGCQRHRPEQLVDREQGRGRADEGGHERHDERPEQRRALDVGRHREEARQREQRHVDAHEGHGHDLRAVAPQPRALEPVVKTRPDRRQVCLDGVDRHRGSPAPVRSMGRAAHTAQSGRIARRSRPNGVPRPPRRRPSMPDLPSTPSCMQRS